MKKSQKRLQQLNITLTEEDVKIVDLLREKYAVNISGCFKIFIREHLRKMDLVSDAFAKVEGHDLNVSSVFAPDTKEGKKELRDLKKWKPRQ